MQRECWSGWRIQTQDFYSLDWVCFRFSSHFISTVFCLHFHLSVAAGYTERQVCRQARMLQTAFYSWASGWGKQRAGSPCCEKRRTLWAGLTDWGPCSASSCWYVSPLRFKLFTFYFSYVRMMGSTLACPSGAIKRRDFFVKSLISPVTLYTGEMPLHFCRNTCVHTSSELVHQLCTVECFINSFPQSHKIINFSLCL